MIKAHLEKCPISYGSKLRIIRYPNGPGPGSAMAFSITEDYEVSPGTEIPWACPMNVASDLVQAIMDAGWEAGIRPLGHADESSAIRRVEDHLADMRRLVFEATFIPAKDLKEKK